MIISEGKLTPETLSGQVAIVTGGGDGIGFEAARALAWLGAYVIIAEINPETGKVAFEKISDELGSTKVEFIRTDVGDEKSVHNLAIKLARSHRVVDILLNNAAVEPVGAVKNCAIEDWDLSYRVNLRGPVLITREFLPAMLERTHGVIVFVTSVGGAFMGPYETQKAAQVELANTLDAECANTGVSVFTIGPGLVLETPGAQASVPKVAKLMSMNLEEFYKLGQDALLTVEAAGAGFAAAIARAAEFRGKMISSFEALQGAGIVFGQKVDLSNNPLTPEKAAMVLDQMQKIRAILEDRNKEWQILGVFQRKWMFGDFAKRVGISVGEFINLLQKSRAEVSIGHSRELHQVGPFAFKLVKYFEHLQELTRGYLKEPKLLADQLQLQQQWQASAQSLGTFIQRIAE
ncbi:MAG: 3-oxoacyl-ACP reductase [Promethearchaeota archaeon CR_4]|nr:MAG: 3-oxoacyl-ACP reductase [Candidatus Lokiarchaeota archaeon CR_4]